jgi:hypothetical protein
VRRAVVARQNFVVVEEDGLGHGRNCVSDLRASD